MRKLLFAFAILSSWCCHAEGGFYAGIGGGYANITSIPQSGYIFNNGNSDSQNSGAIAAGIYGGYNFNHIIGVQGDYNLGFDAPAGSSYNVSQQLLDATLVLHLPFGFITDALRGFSLYAKGGLGYSVYGFSSVLQGCPTCVNPPDNTHAFTNVYGLGAEYQLNNLGVRAEWSASGNVTAPNMGSNQVQLNSTFYLVSILYYF